MSTTDKEKRERPSHISRNVAVASGAAIVLLVGYLSLEAFRGDSPPRVTFEVAAEEGWTDGASAYVPIDVRNEGGRTAAAIEVETTFETPGEEPVVARSVIGFLAGGEVRRIYAIGPAGASPSVRVIGFQEP